MKLVNALIMILALSSCGQIKNIMDGTEKLPSQIQETNNGMAKTNEAIRLQKIGVALGIMQDPKNRVTLAPIPSDMMSGGKIMGESLHADEALLFVKNYLVKINEVSFADTYPLADEGTEEGQKLKFAFMMDKLADLSMLIVVSGNIPDDLIEQMVVEQSEQGAYRDILFQLLKMRAAYYSDMMLHAAMLDGDKKLETLGQIEKAMEYAGKLDYICDLEFVPQIAMKISAFDEKKNAKLSESLDPKVCSDLWKKIQEKAQGDFKAQSFHSNSGKNESSLTEYNAKYKKLLEEIQKKVDHAG